jgi:hypothetical protein
VKVKEAAIVHGYDGWSISISERPVWAVAGETIWEWVWFNVLRDPCCKWRIFQTRLGQYPGFWLMQAPCKLFYPQDKGGKRHSHWSYPVHDEWVAEHFPHYVLRDDEPFTDDDLKDPDHGVKCPVCGYGRVNDDPKQNIEKHGKCFRCIVAEKITYQDPYH